MYTEKVAIFALLDSNSNVNIRDSQLTLTNITGNNIALSFPVHITIRTPFTIKKEDRESLVNLVKFININTLKYDDISLGLSYPIFIEPSFCWIEVNRKKLYYLHNRFEEITSKFVTKELTTSKYKFSGFRPHITLGWGVRYEHYKRFTKLPNVDSCLSDLRCKLSQISLACYPSKWPEKGKVYCVK